MIVDACKVVCEKFKIKSFNLHQKQAFIALVGAKKDVFVNLPTGFGKSFTYQARPWLDILTQWEWHAQLCSADVCGEGERDQHKKRLQGGHTKNRSEIVALKRIFHSLNLHHKLPWIHSNAPKDNSCSKIENNNSVRIDILIWLKLKRIINALTD